MADNRRPDRARPTQSDVARLAGVSQAMVSYVLNNRPVSVPATTRSRVLDAIETLGYVPDSAARTLRTRRTMTLALVIPDIANPFYPAVQRGVQEVAEQSGFHVITYNTDGLAAKEQASLAFLREARADGAIIFGFHLTLEHYQDLSRIGLAVAYVGPLGVQSHGPIDHLHLDNAAAAELAVNHLIEAGYHRIATLAGPVDTPPGYERLAGFRASLTAAGRPSGEDTVAHAEMTEDGGRLAMTSLLSRHPRPDAVFAANDLMALGALDAIRMAGLSVPADLGLIGFDDIPFARLITPPLTTIATQQRELGRRAAELVVERITGIEVGPGRFELMPFRLVQRESTRVTPDRPTAPVHTG